MAVKTTIVLALVGLVAVAHAVPSIPRSSEETGDNIDDSELLYHTPDSTIIGPIGVLRQNDAPMTSTDSTEELKPVEAKADAEQNMDLKSANDDLGESNDRDKRKSGSSGSEDVSDTTESLEGEDMKRDETIILAKAAAIKAGLVAWPLWAWWG